MDHVRSEESRGSDGLGREHLDTVARILDRDLSRLADEVRMYPVEADLWKGAPGIQNPAGTLALHLAGNLNHYVGAVLGNTGYVRDRDAEFQDRTASRDEILAAIEDVRATVGNVLADLPPAALLERYPDPPERLEGSSVAYFLTHLASHLGYHLGQVNYLRRILCKDGSGP